MLPFVHRLYPNSHYLHRLVVIFLTFSPTFIILTISYEGLFYFVFCITVLTWVRREHSIYAHISPRRSKSTSTHNSSPYSPFQPASNITTQNPPPEGPRAFEYRYRGLTTTDARIAQFFLFLLQSAFFSTGNIASISSFSLDSVYRLIPVFNPFSQAALLILKILIPFAIISANLGILNRRLGVAPSALFMIVMAISDIMTLNFFYMVRDEGSWLDIGTTISHYCISSFLCVFVAGLEFLSETLIAGVDVGTSAPATGERAAGRSSGAAVSRAMGMASPSRSPDGSFNKPVEPGFPLVSEIPTSETIGNVQAQRDYHDKVLANGDANGEMKGSDTLLSTATTTVTIGLVVADGKEQQRVPEDGGEYRERKG